MGRSIPTDETDLLIHPLLSFSLVAAGMAATIAIITALCSFRRKPKLNAENILQSPASKTKEESSDVVDNAAAATTLTRESETIDGSELQSNKELPLPPGMKNAVVLGDQTTNVSSTASIHVNTTPSHMKKSASDRRLLSHLSIKLPRSLSMAKRGEKSKEEYNNKRKSTGTGKLSLSTKPEDSIWMKTIILGEKCKVSEEEDDVVIYDAKGRRIPAYHPKSRQNSFIDASAIPNNNQRMSTSRQTSSIDPSAIPDQMTGGNITNSNVVEVERNDGIQELDENHQELLSLSRM